MLMVHSPNRRTGSLEVLDISQWIGWMIGLPISLHLLYPVMKDVAQVSSNILISMWYASVMYCKAAFMSSLFISKRTLDPLTTVTSLKNLSQFKSSKPGNALRPNKCLVVSLSDTWNEQWKSISANCTLAINSPLSGIVPVAHFAFVC